jgi:hypothetical protein
MVAPNSTKPGLISFPYFIYDPGDCLVVVGAFVDVILIRVVRRGAGATRWKFRNRRRHVLPISPPSIDASNIGTCVSRRMTRGRNREGIK